MAVDPARVKSLFLAASDLADPAERAAYLNRECGADAELRARVEALLRANDAAPLSESQPSPATGDYVSDAPADDASAEPARPDEQAGTVIAGKYTLVDRIGEGGMGTVWRARQTEPVKRFVAVKLIKAGMDSRQVLARFEAERQALALMDHPHIAKVLDGGLHEQRPFFVMELVKGVPITDFCDARKLTPKERLELFVPVCQAIQHAHHKGIIHRDIKPSNVLIALYDDKPVVKVIDFGVAKATGGTLTEHTIETGFGGVVGTPQYMSPEQATLNNLDIDTRSDVYALGVLLYELLTGSPPFARKELQKAGMLEILRVVREEEPPRPSAKLSTAEALPSLSAKRGTEPKKLTGLLRNELDWLVMKALEKDRSRRYETANGFAADVLRYLGGEAVLAHPPSTAYRLRKFVKRYKGQVLAASLVFVALVAGIVGTTLGLLEAKKQEAEARRQEGLALVAADEERQAKLREAERAEGEKAAKLEAQKNLQQAEENLAFAKKGNEILGSVFTGLDPKKNYATLGEMSQALTDNLHKAVQELEGSAIGDPLTVAGMQITLGYSLLGLGEPSQAIVLFRKARATRAARLGPDHPDTLISMGALAMGYYEAGNQDLALPLFKETLKLSKAKLGPEHRFTLSCMGNLAMTYHADGKWDLALPLFEQTLKLQKAKLGLDDPGTLNTMNSLAMAYKEAGELDLALSLWEETLKLTKAELGPVHPQTLAVMNSLALAYHAARRGNPALLLWEETLKLTRAKFGPEHPYTLRTMNNLALAYGQAGKLDLALPLHKEAFKTLKAKLGPDHPDTLTIMGNLAEAYLNGEKLDLALPLYEETLKLRKAKLGPDHPDTLDIMGKLASAYQHAGKLDLALPLYEETFKLRKAKLGPEHPDTLLTMANLASAYWRAKQFNKSIPLYEETLKHYEAKRGRNHPDTLHTVANLGVNYKDAGLVKKAIPLLEEAHRAAKKYPKLRGFDWELLDAYAKARENTKFAALLQEQEETLKLQKAKLGPDHPDTLDIMGKLAGAYQKAGKLDLALPLYEETLKRQKAKLGPEHPDTLLTMANLATAYWWAKQLDKSIPLFEETLKHHEAKRGRNNLETLRTVANLGVNYKDAGRVKEAIPLLEEAYRAAKKYPSLGGFSPALLDAYDKAGENAKFAALLREQLAEVRKQLPKDSPQLAGVLAQFGLSLLQAHAFADAESLLRECLASREKTQPDAWSTFNTMSMLGGALLGQKKYADAEPLLLKGYEGMKAREKTIPRAGGGELRIPEALDRLIGLYTAKDKPDEAKKWRAERAKYPEAKKPVAPAKK